MSVDHTMDTTECAQYFVYQHNSPYKQIQIKFLQTVESSNPENIIVIMRYNISNMLYNIVNIIFLTIFHLL